MPETDAGDGYQDRTGDDGKHCQVACLSLFARLGSVKRTARTHPNQSTVKKSDSETVKTDRWVNSIQG